MGKKQRGRKRQVVDPNDIDEQLKLQRLKKQQETIEVENRTDEKPRKALGGYVYDSARDAYFPKGFAKSRGGSIIRGGGKAREASMRFPLARSRTVPHIHLHMSSGATSNDAKPAALCHMAQLCQHPFDRRKIISRWNGRLQLESLNTHVVPFDHVRFLNSLHRYDGHSGYEGGHLDSGCYAPWLNTFDVHSTNMDKLPSIVSVGKSKSELCGHNYFGQHVKVLPTIRTGDANVYGHYYSEERASRFRLWDGGIFLLEEACTEVNDFAALSHLDSIVFAGNNGTRRSYNYHRQEFASSLAMDRAPSDLLCVETDSSAPDDIYFGHRDGQVTMCDVRTAHVESSRPRRESSNHNFGSVVGMQLLFDQRPRQILVRGSMKTCCLLLDMRRVGGPRDCRNRSAIVREMLLPPEQNDAMSSTSSFTTPTKGMATDPCRTIAIVPYSDGSKQACLGMWSIESGEFVGRKTVQVNQSPGSKSEIPAEQRSSQVMELCCRVTRAYNLTKPWFERAKTVPGSFGLWLQYGGIHHVTVNGKVSS